MLARLVSNFRPQVIYPSQDYSAGITGVSHHTRPVKDLYMHSLHPIHGNCFMSAVECPEQHLAGTRHAINIY